jgi:hypothetical protein
MKLETLCYLLAVIGTILTIIGRRLLNHEASSISSGWQWAVRFLPLADVLFLAKYWDYAKVGAFTSLAGLGFLLPLAAKSIWDKKHIGPAEYVARGHALDGDARGTIYMDLKGELDARIEAKQRKLQQLNTHLGAWYSNMAARRALLTDATPEQLTEFSTEAEAYKALHQVTKDEAAVLQELLNKQAKGFSAYTEEDFGRYLVERDEQREREEQRAARMHGTGNATGESGGAQ